MWRHNHDDAAQPSAANLARASWLQSLRPVCRVAELELLADFTRMGLFDRLFGKRKEDADALWQQPVIQELCITLIRIIPPHWKSVALTLDVPEYGLGQGLSHSISSPESHKDVVIPTMEVFAVTRKLELRWVERKSTFKKAIISAQRNGEDWVIKSEYEH